MKDTVGNEIWVPPSCDCGLTGGCEKCKPAHFETKPIIVEPEKVEDEGGE